MGLVSVVPVQGAPRTRVSRRSAAGRAPAPPAEGDAGAFVLRSGRCPVRADEPSLPWPRTRGVGCALCSPNQVMFGSHIHDAIFSGSAFEYSKPAYHAAAQVRCPVDLGSFGDPAWATRQCRQLVHRRGERCGICYPAYRSSVSQRLRESSASGIVRLLHRKVRPVWIEATVASLSRRVPWTPDAARA
jgi:hypothetical protein